MSRKTTSAERGLPGSPMMGIPSLAARRVGLPGLMARPWHQISAPDGGDGRGRLVARADRRARADDHHVAVGERVAERVVQRAGVVADDLRRVRPPAGLAHQRAHGAAQRVAHLSGADGARRRAR